MRLLFLGNTVKDKISLRCYIRKDAIAPFPPHGAQTGDAIAFPSKQTRLTALVAQPNRERRTAEQGDRPSPYPAGARGHPRAAHRQNRLSPGTNPLWQTQLQVCGWGAARAVLVCISAGGRKTAIALHWQNLNPLAIRLGNSRAYKLERRSWLKDSTCASSSSQAARTTANPASLVNSAVAGAN